MSCCPPESLGPHHSHGDQSISKHVQVLPACDDHSLDPLRVLVLGSGPRCLLIVYDIFGLEGSRVQDVAAQFLALLGPEDYTVVVPDFYRGDDCERAGVAPPHDGFSNWLKQFHPDLLLGTLKWQVFPFLKESCSIRFPLAMMGFCWGAWLVLRTCADPQLSDLIACGLNMHPSFRAEKMFNTTDNDAVEQLVTKVKCPQLILPASNDPPEVYPGGEIEKILISNGIETTITPYPDMVHGWVTRGDTSEPTTKRDVDKAIAQGAAFVAKYLGA